MPEVETIPEIAAVEEWPEHPRLLVEWSSPWEEFKTALQPALARAPRPLAGEAPIGIFPYRGILAAWVLEFLLLIAVIVLPEQIAVFQPVALPQKPHWDVIYYSGDELPQTVDRGGAQTGKSGRAGGEQAHHRTQTIRVARGDKPGEKVVDAPNLKLPHSDSAVANLLALTPNAGPPPAEGLRSSLVAPLLPATSAVPPSPELQSSSGRAQPSLQSSVVAPAPEVSHAESRTAPVLNPSLIAPAPDVARNKMPTANPLSANVVAPPPTDAQRDLAASRSPITPTASVVAPPVSAPSRDSSSLAKLSLPAPAVVAPPPSQVSRDLNSWGGSNSGDIRTQPVPPPPSMAGGGSTRSAAGTLTAQPVAPPPTVSGGSSAGRSGAGTLTAQVVPPPATIDGLSGTGSGNGAGGSSAQGNARAGAAQLGPATVVPPPPGIGGGKALSGSGRGNKGTGAGGPLDLGSPLAPPANAGGNTAGTGAIISTNPGSKVGLPNSNGAGALAMSPSGTAKTGLGGSGGGAGIGRGNGPGSGLTGEGSGAGKEGTSRGSDPNARGGISPYPGPGGAGSGTSGSPAMPGVSVEGGTTTITLPSFGTPGGDPPGGPGRSATDPHKGFHATVEATSRSGGVLGTGYYGVLKGQNYSIYIPTSLGTAVMQYADPSSATHASKEVLSAPEPLRNELPAGLRPSRVIIACILDRSGVLKNVKVLEPGAAETTSKILVALPSWKFRPAFRGNEPVEVNAILGFGVDTR